LALHGAMVAEGHLEADGELLRRVRVAVGPELPVVATMDFHANVSEMAAEAATAVVVYRTNPHVDQREGGCRAAALLARLVRAWQAGGRRTATVARRGPVVARQQPPMLWNILHQNTSREPLRSVLAETARLEAMPSVLAAHVAIGYPYADVPSVGPCAL